MSKSAERAGIAYHKSEQALEEISRLRKELKKVSDITFCIGMTLLLSGTFLDQICYLLQINHASGFGYIQLGMFFSGIIITMVGLTR